MKFYRLTGGDEGMPVLRPSLLGMSLEAMPKIEYLIGPFYYYVIERGEIVFAGPPDDVERDPSVLRIIGAT